MIERGFLQIDVGSDVLAIGFVSTKLERTLERMVDEFRVVCEDELEA